MPTVAALGKFESYRTFHFKKDIHMSGTSLLLMLYEIELRQGAVPSHCFVFGLFAEQLFDRVYKTLHSCS